MIFTYLINEFVARSPILENSLQNELDKTTARITVVRQTKLDKRVHRAARILNIQ